MSKELEALSLLVEKSIYGNKENNRGNIFQAEKTIKQALTPPTKQEVCEALSEYLKITLFINDENDIKTKSTIDNKTKFIAWLDDGVVRIYVDLPPHLITMIGRFYEGKAQDE